MDAPRRCILFLVLLAGLVGPAVAQETASTPVAPADNAEIDKQIKVYKTTLLEGKDEETRLYAATLLLSNGNGEARKELLDVLRDEGHPEARVAVCKALITAREDRKAVANKEELIEPLMGVLSTENDPSRAELAAQALLIFRYDDIAKPLEQLLNSADAGQTARFNAIRALKYQPDDQAIFTLVGLLRRQDEGLAAEAGKALELLGIDVPADAQGIDTLEAGLKSRGPEAYLKNPLIMRNWLVSRENRIRELAAAQTLWEQKYLAALGSLYDAQADEKARSEFLARQLSAAEPSVKMWALGKLEELRKGTGKGKLSEQLEKLVLGLVSYRDRRVRLKTAGLLTLMWELDSTRQLLDQLKVEEDSEVRQALFVALGNACYYASLPTSSVQIPEGVRKETLELAVAFLNESVPERIRSGADVIRKLLEQDGLGAKDVNNYLTALAERYRQVSPTVNHGLRGELLSAMATLCSSRSVIRAQAAKLYSPVFEEALGDEVESVRQAAVDGLINIDKSAALRRLRPDFVKDPSVGIRSRLIELAGDVGGQEDLDWLSKKLGTAGEGEPAWQAMLKILRRSNTDMMSQWIARFDALPAPNRLSPEQMISFLALVEQKAQGDNKADVLMEVRLRLFALYVVGNDTARATEYMNLIVTAANTEKDKNAVAIRLLNTCLQAGDAQVDLAGAVVESYLTERDLGPDSPMAKSLKAYLSEPPAGADPNALIARLRRIKVKQPEKRSLWQQLVAEWEAFAKAKKTVPVEQTNN